MNPARVPPAEASKRNFLFFVAAALFYLTAAMQGFTAHRHRSAQSQIFWITAALTACTGTITLVRGISARNNAPRG